MFFVIAGISPKVKILSQTPRLCPSCGLAQARLKRIDHYFSLFFIPLFRVGKGEPFVSCDRCETLSGDQWADKKCGTCGKISDGKFRYCPFCGAKI